MKRLRMLRWQIRHETRWRASRAVERLIMAIVWRLPRSIVYWSAIRLGARATTGEYGSQDVPELRFVDALQRWR